MPKKYKPIQDDYIFFSSALSVYGMLSPIENKLRAAGYAGLVLADFNSAIYEAQGIQKEASYDYITAHQNADLDRDGIIIYDIDKFQFYEVLSEAGQKEFYDYIKRYEKHIDHDQEYAFRGISR